MAAGTTMVRVAVDHLGSTEPSVSASPRRFSPVRDQNSHRVPVLYADEDLGCALGESVFHDLPDDPSTPAEVFRADLLALRAGTIALTAPVGLVDLTDAALAGYGYGRRDVIDTTAVDYPVTRLWAQHAWNSTSCAGLVWNSRRSPDRLSFMLFVNPPRPADRPRALRRRDQLEVVAPPLPLYDGDGLAAVMTVAVTRNVTIIV
ncbi:MAG: RES family NAD+ phosphorylase [Acidimicrobiales bacterium]